MTRHPRIVVRILALAVSLALAYHGGRALLACF